ncbi:MAG: CoA-binding protein, partial [Acidimicrobiales bacterium]
MLEARSIALVGASPRPGTFGQRMLDEVTRSPARPEVYPVNPRYAEIGGLPCVPSLADLPGPVDLVLLAVPDAALEQQLTLAASRGDRSAVIFGNAHEDPDAAWPPPPPASATGHPAPASASATGHPAPASASATGHPDPASASATGHPDPGRSMYQRAASNEPIGTSMPWPAEPVGAVGAVGLAGSAGPLRDRLAAIARQAGMQLCGAGCMGFVNVARGLRAIGYTEPDPLPVGPIALVTHSGSVFSMMLRTRRAIGYS